MLYASYKDNLVYNSQQMINFPRSAPDPTSTSTDRFAVRAGEGSAIFLLTPNRSKAVECINDPKMNFTVCLTKRVLTDSVYRAKIGTKRVNSLERSKTDRFYMEQKELPLAYIPAASKHVILAKKKNVVYDMSRWMEILFARTERLSAKKKCAECINLLASKLNDPLFAHYSKLLVFDVNSWSATVKNCVIMNKKLLNNPLSILLYAAVYFPELLNNLPNTRLMIVNRSGGQIYLIHTKDITKKMYPKIKQKLSRFKDLVFSAEDDIDPEVTEETIDAEVKAEVVNSFKEDIKEKMRFNLLGSASGGNPFDDIADITGDVAEPFDEELEAEAQAAEDQEEKKGKRGRKKKEETVDDGTDDDALMDDLGISDEISKEVDEVFETIEDVDDIDPSLLAMQLADKVKHRKYKAAFMPQRSKAELAKIERLTAQQTKVLELPSLDDVKRKSISTSTTGGYIKTTNPHIVSSKFVNFDREYAEKCLEKNIDDSVAQLSEASGKIFVTGKSKRDSSDPQNMKEKYTYNLVDEKGNRMTVSFDVPKIIDGSYVYLNGTKKNIRHQFILKPIVKTSPDTVQLVTAYNKVFIRREGNVNQNINRLNVFMEKNPEEFKVKLGNCSMRNGAYEVPLDFAMLSRYFSEFTIGDVTFFMAIDILLERVKKVLHKEVVYDETKELPVGINMKKKEVVYLKLDESYTELVSSYFTDEQKKQIAAIKRKPKFVMATAKMLKRVIPLVLFMMYCEGFASVMKKANINYQFVKKIDKKTFDPMNWDSIELADGFILWEKTPFRNELLMNGFKKCDLSDFTYDELESKDTFVSLILPFYPGNQKIADALDNYRDFLLDAKAKEILTDLGYPTDLVELLVVAAGLLTDTSYIIENNLNNMRIRSNEVIADLVYIQITNAYKAYRATSYKKKPTKLSIKKSAVCDALLDSDTNMIEESSTLNPVLELEKQRSVTFKGIRGIQLDRAMTLPRRCYDHSMLGTVGISTSADANCGVVRELTLEPNITSTYGYIDTSKSLDEMSGANLFIASELLQPMGVMHDDPDRTSMSYKQTKYMIPVKDADPVLIGNKVEATVPYLLSDEFVVDAKQSGKVIERDADYCVVEYKDGTKYAIEISSRVRKNSAAGFWIDNTLKCDLKVGDKFQQGDILAYNDKHFTKNREDRGVSMNLGVLCKIAITSQWDIFEDSAPISKRLSDKLTSEMVDEKHITLSPYTYVEYMVKVGDKIKAGEPLITFSDAPDAEIQRLLAAERESTKNSIIESAKTTVSSKYTGEIADIRIYTTTDPKDLDPSLRKIVETYWKRISKRNDTLRRNKNEGDLNYYCAGQVINEVAEVVRPGKNGRIQGYEIGEGEVLILFYVKYPVAASKGDKVVVSVCKGIISHVIEEGLEPYSEYRPDEPIDTLVAPLAVAARKVPAIFLTIFGNKLIIELKKQLEEIYLENK